MSRSRISCDLIRASKLYIIDTEGGCRLSQFCAISFHDHHHHHYQQQYHNNNDEHKQFTSEQESSSSSSKSECLNLYNTDAMRARAIKSSRQAAARAAKIDASQCGNWLSHRTMLAAIKQYFARSHEPSILIGHSAISADSTHLTANLLRDYREKRRRVALPHSRIAGYIDTLHLFRRLFPDLQSYRQRDLVRYFLGVPRYNAHNALDDSLMLFTLWRRFLWPAASGNLQVLSDASASNQYCVDRFLQKEQDKYNNNNDDDGNSIFRVKQYFERLTKSNANLVGQDGDSNSSVDGDENQQLVAVTPKKQRRRQSTTIRVYRTQSLLNNFYPELVD